MYIKAVEKCTTPSHTLKKGAVVNMRAQDAQKLIDKDEAKALTKAELAKHLKTVEPDEDKKE